MMINDYETIYYSESDKIKVAAYTVNFFCGKIYTNG